MNPKCKWAKYPNQQTQTGKLDKKTKPRGVLYPGNPSHMQGCTKIQNKGMEEDLPSNWRAKKEKKKGVAILVSDQIDFKLTRQRRILHNGKRINATRRANDSKYIRTQYGSTQIHKASS